MNKLWTRASWIAPSISICDCRPYLSVLLLSDISVFFLCLKLFSSHSSFRCFPLRSAKPRLCWIMNNAWAVHEQFMNKVGLAFLANTWPESFGKWYLIVCARTCLRDWKNTASATFAEKMYERLQFFPPDSWTVRCFFIYERPRPGWFWPSFFAHDNISFYMLYALEAEMGS